jgi:phage/plasmid-like protein (TIGR03299 family)
MRTAAIHAIGHNVEGFSSVEDIIQEKGMGWTASKRPLSFMGMDGQAIQISDKVAVVRDDNDFVLNVTSPDYNILQNPEAFAWMDALAGEGGRFVHAGEFRGGRKIFIQAQIGPDWLLGGHPNEGHSTFLTAYNSHDGSAGEFFFTNFRISCYNSLRYASKEANAREGVFKVHHRKGMHGKLSEVARVLGASEEQRKEYEAKCVLLMQQQVSDSFVEDFLAEIIPAEVKIVDGEKTIATRAENRRKEIEELFRNGIGNNGKTAYDLLQGVTEWVDHFQSGRVTQKRLNAENAQTDIEAEQRFERTQFGVGAKLKAQAFELLTA